MGRALRGDVQRHHPSEELIAPVSETSGYRAVTFSQDGERVYTGGQDGTIRIWDATSGENLRTLVGHTGVVGVLAFSPDFRSFVSGDNGVKFWDLGPGRELFVAPAGTGGAAPLALTPDGLTLVAGGPGPTINRYDPQTGERLQPFADLELDEGVSLTGGMDVTSDGHYLATASFDGKAIVWDLSDGTMVTEYTGHDGWVMGLAFTPDD